MSGNDYMISRKLNPKSTVKTVKKPIISFHRSPIQVFWKQWHQILMLLKFVSSQVVLVVKNTCQCRRHKRHGFNFWVRSGRSPGKGNGNPLQYSCLENSMSREAWRTTVHGIVSQNTTEATSMHMGFKREESFEDLYRKDSKMATLSSRQTSPLTEDQKCIVCRG